MDTDLDLHDASILTEGDLPCLRLTDLSKSFPDPSGGSIAVLQRINASIPRGKLTYIIGPSGSGKSTILALICGFDHPNKGSIIWDSEQPLQPGNGIGIVFQDTALFPWKTVVQNVEFGLKMRGLKKKEYRGQALEYLNRVGLTRFAHHTPDQLSEGMRQRVSVARTLITRPQLVILDEAFRSLDALARYKMQDLLLQLHREEHFTLLAVTHDITEAVRLADHIFIFRGKPVNTISALDVTIAQPREGSPHTFHLEARLMKLLMQTVESDE